MDGSTFDRLIATMSRHGTRRGLFGLVAALPLLSGLFEDIDVDAKGRRKRRKKRHKHRVGDGKDNGKGRQKGDQKAGCAETGQIPRPGKPCCNGLSADGTGRCVAPSLPAPPSPPASPPPPPPCIPEPATTTCAGLCGPQTNTCGQRVACDLCPWGTPCTADEQCVTDICNPIYGNCQDCLPFASGFQGCARDAECCPGLRCLNPGANGECAP